MHSPLILEITQNFPSNLKKDIDTLLSADHYTGIWQTIEWQIMLLNTGYASKSFFIGVYKERDLISYILVEKRSIGMSQYGLFSLGGPVGGNKEAEEIISTTLRQLSEKEKVVFVQIESLKSSVLNGFKQGEYKHFIEKHTAIINLDQNEETILTNMKPKGRYNIRVAEKSGVIIESAPYSTENLDIFYNLLSETRERDKFSANSKEYFKIFLQYLEKYKLGGLMLAKRENEVIAGGIFIYYKNTAFYYYGASSSDNNKRKYMATYLLQWQAIREGKKRGCKIFDFLGIANPTDTESPLTGVTDFKLKLTNETIQWPDSQILIIRTYVYYIIICLRKVKKSLPF